MAGNGSNRRLLFGLRGFLTILVIAFAIMLACFVDETESARENKESKNVKSSKDKVREIFHISVSVSLTDCTSLQQVARSLSFNDLVCKLSGRLRVSA